VKGGITEGGVALIQAEDGPCEDAPCCGCCGTVPVPRTIEFDHNSAMSLLFDEDGHDDSLPIDLDEVPLSELADYDFAKIKIPDGIDLTAATAVIEEQLEARFKIEERTAGAFYLVITPEAGKPVARIHSR
jgi:hypothetical protein